MAASFNIHSWMQQQPEELRGFQRQEEPPQFTQQSSRPGPQPRRMPTESGGTRVDSPSMSQWNINLVL